MIDIKYQIYLFLVSHYKSNNYIYGNLFKSKYRLEKIKKLTINI